MSRYKKYSYLLDSHTDHNYYTYWGRLQALLEAIQHAAFLSCHLSIGNTTSLPDKVKSRLSSTFKEKYHLVKFMQDFSKNLSIKYKDKSI